MEQFIPEAPSSPVHTEEARERAAEPSLVDAVHVSVIKGPDEGKAFHSQDSSLTVGTHERAGACLTDKAVSRFHCRIEVDGGRLRVVDLGSRNGTRVDGVELRDGYARLGSVLKVGRSLLRCELGPDKIAIPMSSADRFGMLRGRSIAMRRVFARLERVAAHPTTVLIRGESGTGKELAARSLHDASPRASGPFVTVDCASLPPDLLEGELFGAVKGAYTSAQRDRAGALELANGGTLFLDAVDELPLDLQPKLLRFLDRREVKRIGDEEVRPVDVRVIAASRTELKTEVNSGRFRADLYYRLAVVDVYLPPLSQRLDDLPLLIGDLLESLGGREHDLAERLLSPGFAAQLAEREWPGNVRELRNYLERALTVEDMRALGDALPPEGGNEASLPLRVARERWTARFEKQYLEGLLRETAGNVSAAARKAGIDRVYLYRLLWRHGMK